MLFKQRFFYGQAGVLKDLSAPLSNVHSTATVIPAFVAATGYLYIGSDLPFTHRYFSFGSVPNAASSILTELAIWDSRAWVPAVDVIDGTLSSTGTSTLNRAGILQWTTPRNSAAWGQVSTTRNMTGSGLENLDIYDLYWIRLKFTANLTANLTLKYVGHLFSNDDDFKGYYPDLMRSEVLDAFQSGKTNWADQHLQSAEEILIYLRRKKFVWSPNQLQNWQQYLIASVHKTAEIVYSAFPGDDFEDRRKLAESKYYKNINQGSFDVDLNENGRVEPIERRPNVGLVRQ